MSIAMSGSIINDEDRAPSECRAPMRAATQPVGGGAGDRGHFVVLAGNLLERE